MSWADMCAEPDKTVPKPPIRWDRYYENAKSDLILLANDNTAFRVDSWVFAKKCHFVRSLLDVPSDQPLEEAPITLDYHPVMIRYFIDFVTCRSGTLEPGTGIEEYNALLELCDRFEAPLVNSAILRSLRCRMCMRDGPNGLDSWEVFLIAARHDDPFLAKAALANMGRDGYSTRQMIYDETSRFILADIPVKYAAALLKSAWTVENEVQYDWEGTETTTEQWTVNDVNGMAASFEVEEGIQSDEDMGHTM